MWLATAASTMAGECGDGQVRLANGNTDENALTMDGRLEICFNDAWGTVCNNSFRLVDAQVACHQLTGFSREGISGFPNSHPNVFPHYLFPGAHTVVPRSPLQEGPIFLDKLFCTGLDQTLQDCSLGIRAIGLTTCNHTQDVWLQCSGNASLSGA